MVRFLTTSTNFFGFSILSKKSSSDVRIKDLALSWAHGAIKTFKSKLKSTNKNENFIIKLIKLILLIPKFQNIISSFLSSYLSNMYEKDKKIAKG